MAFEGIRRDTHFAIDIEQRLVNETQTGIPFSFEKYLTLVDWTGRIIRSDKRGDIDNPVPYIRDDSIDRSLSSIRDNYHILIPYH